jgi:adenylate cyclase
MTVRIKILALSVALLLIFAVVLVSSVVMQRRTSHQVSAIIDFHLPLAAVISDLDVATDEFELVVDRLLLLPTVTPSAVEAGRAAVDQDRARIASDFQRADTLLNEALVDSRTNTEDRLVLARVQRSLVYLKRQQDSFFALGNEVLSALAAGRLKEAQALAPRFKSFEQAFGPDMAALRNELTALAKASAESIYAQETRVLRLNIVLFALAVVAGLGLSAAGAERLVRALWRLVEGAKAIEGGNLAITLPVTSRDEIGQLAEAFNSMAGQLRSNERIKDTFGKYVDPRIVAQLIDASKDNADHAERRIATVMFSDLKAFTSISEQLTATAMVGLLNRYFTAVAEQLRAHNGIVEKYIGDAIVAFWTPPFAPGETHAASACLAALAHRDAVVALRPELPQLLGLRRNVPDLTVRIGLATGEVVVGTIGAPTAKTFAAIGDTANLASRLEGVNKVYGTTVIVAEETHRLSQDVVEARELDVVIVSGKSEPVRIFELLGATGSVESGLLEIRDLYGKGLEAYRGQDWDSAELRLHECLRLRPDDGPSRVLLERIAAFRATAPAPDWNGVWRLTEK